MLKRANLLLSICPQVRDFAGSAAEPMAQIKIMLYIMLSGCSLSAYGNCTAPHGEAAEFHMYALGYGFANP